MKKIIYLLVVMVLMAACSSEPHYVVKGKIKGSDSITFYLQKREAGKIVTLDSAVSKKGSFKMKGGAVDYPELIQLVAGNTRKRTAFYLENAEITISSQAGNFAKVEQLNKRTDSIQKEMINLQKNFVKNNPASYVSPSILGSLSIEMEADEIESMINGLDTAIAATPQIRSLKERVAVMKSVAVGQKAPDFTMDDVDGNPVALSSKTGAKLLLIDFWAAWCVPCRKENPNVVKVYSEFRKKGFDVFGVSLDRTKDEWVKAIAVDKLTWTQVIDFNGTVAKMYAVNAIPANFLLDETGTIIARNLRGDALFSKVKEILEKK
jgi:peroxiredoxin